MMGEELHSGSTVEPSTAWRSAVSGAICNVDCGSGRGRKGLFRSDVHTFSASSRVQFRADMLQQRRLEREARELERQREEEERQNRLEALRNQVEHYLVFQPLGLVLSVEITHRGKKLDSSLSE